MRKPIKIIFLDVDGVLNGHTFLDYTIWSLFNALGLRKLHRKLFRYPYSVHEEKVRRLGKIVEKTGAVCVMTSTWRWAYFSEDHDVPPDIETLRSLMEKYRIKVIDKTGHDKDGNRGKEILEWLSAHQHEYDYLSYCVLDDDYADLQVFKDVLINTTNNPYLGHGVWTRRNHRFDADGLSMDHVNKAIKILNKIDSLSDPLHYYIDKWLSGNVSMFTLLTQEEYLPLTEGQIYELLMFSTDLSDVNKVLFTRKRTEGISGVF